MAKGRTLQNNDTLRRGSTLNFFPVNASPTRFAARLARVSQDRIHFAQTLPGEYTAREICRN